MNADPAVGLGSDHPEDRGQELQYEHKRQDGPRDDDPVRTYFCHKVMPDSRQDLPPVPGGRASRSPFLLEITGEDVIVGTEAAQKYGGQSW
jgi:hypothetical protein